MGLIIKLLVNALALIITAYIVPGFTVANFTSALIAAFVLGLVNIFIKPIIILITLPVNILTLGLFSFVINALLLWLTASFVNGFAINNFMTALLGAIVLSIVSTVLSMIFKDK